MKTTLVALILLFLAQVRAAALTPLQVYDQTTDLVTRNFYDQTFRGLDWPMLVTQYRKQIDETSTPAKIRVIINNLLDQLHASHTEFLTSDEQEYHGLKSIFSRKIDGDRYYQVGGYYQKVDGHWFVRDVFVGSPLARAGLLSGDEILSVDGQPLQPIRSFDTPQPVTVSYRHEYGRTFFGW